MTTRNAVTARRAHSVPVHATVRRHRSRVARWALANGHLVERDALAVIVAVRADPSGAVDLRWTARHVGHTVWSAVPEWCDAHHVPVPADLATTLGTYLRFLSAHRQLARGSAPISELRRVAADHRPSPSRSRGHHPAGTRTAAVLPISPVLPTC